MRLRPGDLGRRLGRCPEHGLGEAEEHRVHDLLVGNGVSDGLAHLQIVERRILHVHADVLDAVGIGRGDDVELAQILELDEILVRQVVGNVGIAAFEQRAPVAGGGHHAPDDAPHLRQRSAGPLVVALEDDLGAGVPAHHTVGAAAGGVLLGEFKAPGILFVGVLLDELGVVDRGHDHSEIRQRETILAQEIDADRIVVDDHELLGLGQRARAHLEGREAADRNGAVEGPLDVLRRDWCALLEDRVLLQLESDRHVADLHVVGELEPELVAIVILHAVRQRLHLVADEPVVAIPGHLVAGDVGAHAVDVDIVGAALGDDEQRLLARLRLGRRPDRRRRRQYAARRQCGHRFEEFTTLHGNLPIAAGVCIGFRKGRARTG